MHPTLTPKSEPVTAAKGIGMPVKLLYGLGEVPVAVTMAIFGLVVLFFYNSVMRLPAGLTGAGIAAGLALDAVIDPYIGYRSDGFRHRLGRRHPFMFLGAALIGPCFFMLLSPPRHLRTPLLFAWLLISSICFRVVSAIYRIPYLALGAELSQDYDERTRIMGVRAIFGLLAMFGGASLTFFLFFPATPDGLDAKLRYASYPRLGLVWGAVMSLTGLAATWGTLGNRSAEKVHEGALSFLDFFRGFFRAMRSADCRMLWCSVLLFLFAVALNAAVAIPYFTWYVSLPQSNILSQIELSFGGGAIAGVSAWSWLAKRAEKRTLYLCSVGGTSALLAAATLLVGRNHLFGTGNAFPLLAGHFVAGMLASAVWLLPPSMLADIADQEDLETGARRGGIYFGIFNFGEKIAAGGALLTAGLLLQFFVHLAPGAVSQTISTVARLGMVYGLVPALLMVLAALAVIRYDLSRVRMSQIQRELAQRDAFDSGTGTVSPL